MHILCLTCQDQKGIVATVATALSSNKCNIEESSQFNDPRSKNFYMRVVFSGSPDSITKFIDCFPEYAEHFNMHWQIADLEKPVKTMIMVSQYDHCLHHLLYQTQLL